MSKFTIEHESSHNPKEAYEKIKKFLSNDEDLKKFDAKLQSQFDDGSMTGSIKGSQFKADVAVVPAGAGSKVQVTIDLPMLLMAFKGKIQETMSKKLTKYLT
jgi:hypothetical protein